MICSCPTAPANPTREFNGQRFVHHKVDEATWKPFRVPGLQSRDTTIAEHTKDVAGVHVIRVGEGAQELDQTHDRYSVHLRNGGHHDA